MADVSTFVPQFPLPSQNYDYRDQIELRSNMRAALTGVIVAIADLDSQIGAATPTELDDLTDVTLSALGNSEILFSSGGVFINQTLAEAGISAVGHTHAAADVTSGTFDDGRIAESSVTQHATAVLAAGALSSIGDVTITGIASGEVLKWSGSAWINNTLAEAGISAVGHTHVVADITDLDASTVTMAQIGTPVIGTVQKMQDIFHSSGKGTGGDITVSGTADSVDVAAGEGWIRASNDDEAELLAFGWSADTLSVPDNTVRFVGVEYNAGSPQAVVRTANTYNGQSEFYMATVVNDGTSIHIIDNGAHVGDHAAQMILRLLGTQYIAYDRQVAGLALSETGTRNLALTAGRLWSGLEYFDVSALDTSVTGSWDTYYYNGSSWVAGTATQWPNTQYNNTASGLATMTNNWYANLYFYASTDDELYMVYGQAQYSTVGAAESELPPTLLPDAIIYEGLLIGRLTFQKSAGTATDIVSYLGSVPSGSSALSDHGNLSGLGDDDHTQYILVDASRDFTSTPQVNGTAVTLVGHTHVEADITDLGSYEPALGNPASDGYILSSTAAGARSWIANSATVSSLADVGDVDAYATPASGEVLMWDGDSWLHRTLAEASISAVGHTHVEADITDLGTYFEAGDSPTWTGLHVFQGATTTFDGAQDIVVTPGAVPKISSTGVLQLDAASGNYHYFSVNGSTVGTWGADYLTLGPSSTTDLKFHEPTAGEWTIEALSTNNLVLLAGGNEVRIDNANLLIREPADVARAKLMRANTSLASPSAVTAGNWIGDYQWYAYDDAGYDLVAFIRANASETQTATLHGTDMMFYATPDGQTTNDRFMWYDATNDHVEIDKYLLVDDAAAALEITSTADAKIILRDDGTAAWNRIDFYELTDRHGYLGFGTGNNFLIVNEESAGVVEVNTTGGGQFLFNDGGASDGRVASIANLTTSTTAPSSSAYPYGAIWGIYT